MAATEQQHPEWVKPGARATIVRDGIARPVTIARTTRTQVVVEDRYGDIRFRLYPNGAYRQVGDFFGAQLYAPDDPYAAWRSAEARARRVALELEGRAAASRRLVLTAEGLAPEDVADLHRLIDSLAESAAALAAAREAHRGRD